MRLVAVLALCLTGCASQECIVVHNASLTVVAADGSTRASIPGDTVTFCPPQVEKKAR